MKNLFVGLPSRSDAERFDLLLSAPNLRIERIVSTGQATPAGEWYDQEWSEWVVVLSGAAGLRIEGDAEVHVLGPGDHVHLPAHRRHRVEWTSAAEPTVWLAVHHRE
ncbi:MAG TPA: cupin domain-containing protein [Burkholderiaceae bacterium]|jgi:cupin 2 domain-containing protein|nr:cupin domain-containing protein [Burkholderiaceae bacterium]